MRIEKIILNNYRQYGMVEFQFKKNSKNDLHIVIGQNGIGKTNLLNAINWCLYEDEPHISKESERMPLLNIQSIKSSHTNEPIEVTVELYVKGENRYINFIRKHTYKGTIKENPVIANKEFIIQSTDEKGNTKFLRDEDALFIVNRFVPNNIREFFFFDGERLDSYFKETTGIKISNSIFEISRINLLDRIFNRLDKTHSDLQKKASQNNPQIEHARIAFETARDNLKKTNNQITECTKQIELAIQKVNELHEKLRDVPDVEELATERKNLKNKIKEIEQSLEQKKGKREDILFEFGKLQLLYPAIKKSLKIIDEKEKKNEIPPIIDKGLLKEILELEKCKICGNRLDSKSTKHVQKVFDSINITRTVGITLSQMKAPLMIAEREVSNLDNRLKEVTNDVEQFNNDLDKAQKSIDDIDNQLRGFNEKTIVLWSEQLKEYEDLERKNLLLLGELRPQKLKFEREVREREEDLKTELDKDKKIIELKRKINFCHKAYHVVYNSKEKILNDVRKRIEKETRDIFFDLLWKKRSFKDVNIDDSYNIHLIHQYGHECLGSISAGERGLLALSFTLALHKISGFDSPIIIDTPVSRISDIHRANFGKVLGKVSVDKQVVLLFTPSEYSDEISNVLDQLTEHKFILKTTEKETETYLEVL